MIAVPRSSGGWSAPRAETAQQKSRRIADSRAAGLMPFTNTAQLCLFKRKALHTEVKRFGFFAKCGSALNDQALAGDDHPMAVLLADRIDAAEAGNEIAGIDFIGSATV